MQGHPPLWQSHQRVLSPVYPDLGHTRARTHKHAVDIECLARGEIAYDGRQGRCWVEPGWLSDWDHSVAEALSTIPQITSSLGFIFVLELILNSPLCSLFITYCPLLLASSFITGDLSRTSFLSVTLFIVWQGFWRLAVPTYPLALLYNEDSMHQINTGLCAALGRS